MAVSGNTTSYGHRLITAVAIREALDALVNVTRLVHFNAIAFVQYYDTHTHIHTLVCLHVIDR